jgi:hypothetical protein
LFRSVRQAAVSKPALQKGYNMKMAQRLSNSVEYRLGRYALAASTAGAAFAALVPPVNAEIIYRKVDVELRHGGSTLLDINQDGETDFAFKFIPVSDGNASYLSVKGEGVNSVVSFLSRGRNWAAALVDGAEIGPFTGPHAAPMLSAGGSATHFSYGPWAPGTSQNFSRYLGVRFEIAGKMHYGWVRLKIDPLCTSCRNGDKNSGHIVDAAYESVPDKSIIAGKSKGPDDMTQQFTLGYLASGSAAASPLGGE